MKALLIVNPSSGGEKAEEFEGLAKKKLEDLFEAVEIKRTQKSGDATEFAKKAARADFDSVFAMGGDGTVNEAVNGLAQAANPPRFGFFPLGTVNDLARALAIPLEPEEAIEQLSLERTQKIDIGKVNETYFTNIVAIGMIPAAINNVDVEQKTKFGKLAYIFSGLQEVKKNKSYHFSVVADEVKFTIESSTLLIASSNSVGGFEQLLPEAKVDDGKLHFIYIKDANLWESIKSIPELLKGVTKENEAIGYMAVKEIQVALEEDALTLETNVDGDPGDPLPINVQIFPRHLEVYRGRDSKDMTAALYSEK